MAIKLDLGSQREKDKAHPAPRERKAQAKEQPPVPKDTSSRPQGRPKGNPAVTRSLRIRTDINARLVEEQARTGLSFNELANRAFDAYLKQ